ncbi:methylaspartate ammonia-lyase [Solirubrobacter ginsenosidimutans]|uniref:methylaspartate ammonia-lyase n=1 Tax=Solirubrobacter ginsenosidimutans TaxID=490573 RepID=A0A9X3MMI4_9ACTN|nr:methylaspartate ammonia-lyase [Solirubrobacter ginsenosidimutans]MDA0158994.1 methylaspartate ammonia-lyase [Solirubrobacter ginsenosidimutans]
MGELTIAHVLAVPATSGFFADDQAAIKAGAARDGLAYVGAPLTPGFDAIRTPAEAVSVLLVLSDGHVAHGDCVSVQYAGVGGREPRLRAHALAQVFTREVAPRLVGTPVGDFRSTLALIDGLANDIDGFGTAASYGLSQALLDAAARRAGRTMADVVAAEWDLDPRLQAIPVYAQSGEERHSNVDKMILKEADSLPHGLINHRSLVGENGRELIAYVRWVSERVEHLRRSDGYAPILHFDVYGTLGDVCDGDLERVAGVLVAMAEAARPFALRVEHPLDAGSRDGQIRELAALRGRLAGRVEIVADEWANTVDDIRLFNRARAADMVQIKTPDLGSIHHVVEAVIDCQAHGVIAHIGGSCCETERSAQVSVHLALGAHADQLLAKPGMGVDEGLSIVRNEMQRTLALSAALTPSRT